MNCKICDKRSDLLFKSLVLGKFEAQYYYCNGCGFLFTPEPHWLQEAYSSAIARSDTGILARNIQLSKKFACILYFLEQKHGRGRYLDVAGGYGTLVRLMRDLGFNFFWDDKYCENLFARGFELSNTVGPFDAVTATEVMEHIEDPREFVANTLSKTKCSTFLFTTNILDDPPPAPGAWWYYSFETGQHISFYQKRTLETLAQHLNMYFVSAGGVHVISREPLNPKFLRICSNRFSPLAASIAKWRHGSLMLKDLETIMKCLRKG